MAKVEELASSPEEGFSASEDEWKPGKETQGGDTSDDDDSDFDGLQKAGAADIKKKEPKTRNVVKQNAVRKRKSSNQTLRAKLYNKYKPPPKTIARAHINSQSATCSKTKLSSEHDQVFNDDSSKDENSSVSSLDNCLTKQANLRPSCFNVEGKKPVNTVEINPCSESNAGTRLSVSDSENDYESSESNKETGIASKFQKSLLKTSRMKGLNDSIAKKVELVPQQLQVPASAEPDVNSIGLSTSVVHIDNKSGRQYLRQTRSTRHKRHPKTKAQISSSGAADSEDSN